MSASEGDAGEGVPPNRRWIWWGALGVSATLFVIRLAWASAREMVEGRGELASRVFEETSGAVVGLLPLGVLVFLLARNSLATGRWRQSAIVLGATFVPISVVHTWVLIRARALMGPTFGFAQYTTEVSPARYVYEGATDLVHMIAIVATFTVVELVLVRRHRDC